MQMAKRFALQLLMLAMVMVHADARVGLRSNTLAHAKDPTAMASLEGTACSTDEAFRYKKIVCEIEKTCNCGYAKCDLDWCHEWWKSMSQKFGACTQVVDCKEK
mmetsp:Transcript_15053/g.27875  ORF Transcript_15053/g.27875 Transcript_15053/m.27875 type:complete len:104 (+) Transcript_15053:58-369(+)